MILFLRLYFQFISGHSCPEPYSTRFSTTSTHTPAVLLWLLFESNQPPFFLTSPCFYVRFNNRPYYLTWPELTHLSLSPHTYSPMLWRLSKPRLPLSLTHFRFLSYPLVRLGGGHIRIQQVLTSQVLSFKHITHKYNTGLTIIHYNTIIHAYYNTRLQRRSVKIKWKSRVALKNNWF